MIADSIFTILVFGLLGLAFNIIAWKKGFFVLSPLQAPPIDLKHVISVFAIYLSATLIISPYLMSVLQDLSGKNLEFGTMLVVQFFVLLFMLLALFLYSRTQNHVFADVWKNKQSTSPLFFDFGLGVASWLLAFPIVTVASQICDLLLYMLFGTENYEQVAVRYLKTTLQAPSLTVLALISIVVIAPLVEEFLFRGVLQTYFKRRLGVKKGIILASIAFALFHYSSDQGIGNLSLIPSLFTFACFLGYIYERQGSLYASIGLHMAFNFASSFRIIFFPDQ
jgi:hypothetical protein